MENLVMNNDWNSVEGILSIKNLNGDNSKINSENFNTILIGIIRGWAKDSLPKEQSILKAIINGSFKGEEQEKSLQKHLQICSDLFFKIDKEIEGNNFNLNILLDKIEGQKINYLTWLNHIFWGIPVDETSNSNGKLQLVQVLSILNAQDFSISKSARTTPYLENKISEEDFESGTDGLKNYFNRVNESYKKIIDCLAGADTNKLSKEEQNILTIFEREQMQRKKKANTLSSSRPNKTSQKSDLVGSGTLGAVVKLCRKISQQLMKKLEGEIADEIVLQLTNETTISEANKFFNTTIEEELPNIFNNKSSSNQDILKTNTYRKSKGEYVKNNSASLYSEYRLEKLANGEIIIVPVWGKAINFQSYEDDLTKAILEKIQDKIQDFTSLKSEDFFKIVSDAFQEVKNKIETKLHGQLIIKAKKINDNVIENVDIDSATLELREIFDKNGVENSDKVIQELEDSLKNNQQESIKIFKDKLLPAWINIYQMEIGKISSIALEYFNQIYKDVEEEIIKDFENQSSALTNEVFQSLKTYYNMGYSESVSGYTSNFNGTIGEIFSAYLLRKTGLKASQKGRDTSIGYQSIADIELEFNSETNTKYGLQLKQYRENALELYSTTVLIENAGKYLTQEQQSAFMWLIGNETRFPEKYRNSNNIQQTMVNFLYTRLDKFLRYSDTNLEKEGIDLKNYFYIINFNVVPTSMIFLFLLNRINKQQTIANVMTVTSEQVTTKTTAKEINSFKWMPFNAIEYTALENSLTNSNLLSKYHILYRGITFNLSNFLGYFN